MQVGTCATAATIQLDTSNHWSKQSSWSASVSVLPVSDTDRVEVKLIGLN